MCDCALWHLKEIFFQCIKTLFDIYYCGLSKGLKGWGHKINDGVVLVKIHIAPLQKVAALWDFACQACWVRAPTMKKNGSLRPLMNFSKKYPHSLFLSPSFYLPSKTSSVPLWANVWKKAIFFFDAFPDESLAGDKVFHELKESLMVWDLSYLSQRDKMTLLCIALKA